MNHRPAKSDKHAHEVIRASRAIRGIERKEHFASGGTTAMWRGVHTVTPNRKAKANKDACRVRDF
jgi:hypothetical protein